jgi:hypothetical protein
MSLELGWWHTSEASVSERKVQLQCMPHALKQ